MTSNKIRYKGLKSVKKQLTDYKVCEICLKHVKYLNKHTVGVHPTGRNFNCDQCSKSYKTVIPLRDHIKRKHSDSMDHQCSTCGKKFNVDRVLKKHIEQVHGKEDMKCKICNKSFSNIAAVEGHERRHNNKIVKIQCDLCHKLVREEYLEKHKQFHGGQDKKCSICKKGFKTNGELKKHEQIHTERERPYECKVCDAKMHSMKILKSHSLIHTTETPFSCPIENCDQRFNNGGSLFHHKRKHKKITKI